MAIISVMERRNRSGFIETPTWNAPIGLTGRFIVRFVLSEADMSNSANSLELRTYVSDDGGITWRFKIGCTWIGGNPYDIAGAVIPGPGVSFDGREIAGKLIKAELQINPQMRIGFELETVT